MNNYEDKKDVFFVGAGFSKEYGLPIVSEWFDQISQFDKLSISFLRDYNWLKDNEKRSIYDDANLQNDIREIFNLLAGSDSFIKRDICKALIYLSNQIDKKYLKILMTLIGWMGYLNYLEYFRDMKNLNFYKKIIGKNNIVITPNYDNLIDRELPKECYIEENSIKKIKNVHCGFKQNNEEIKYPLILKIHGGHVYVDKSKLNEDTEDFVFVYTNDNKGFIEYKTFKENSGKYGNDIKFKLNGVEYEQVIIPPVDGNTKENLMQSFRTYFNTTKNNVGNELKKSTRVFVIGYSFNELDDHLNDLFNQINHNNVFVVNTGSLNIPVLLRIFPRGCKYLQMTAGDFVAYYPDNLQKCFEKAIEIRCPNH